VTTFRETAQRIASPWLRGWFGSRLLYSLAIPFDGLWESLMRGIGARTPGNDPEADALTGAERRIPRGPAETDAQYALRLTQWRQAVARKGTAFELLRQLHGYLKDSSGTSLWVTLVTNTGWQFNIRENGTEYYLIGGGWNGTDWDGESALWARAWVIIDCGVRYNRSVATWHIGLDPELYSVGSNMPTPVAAGIRGIVNDWTAAHVLNVSIILKFSDSPTLAPSGWARLGDRDGLFNFFGG
jgi:hypothetical protein